jgi:hypothetical protein
MTRTTFCIVLIAGFASTAFSQHHDLPYIFGPYYYASAQAVISHSNDHDYSSANFENFVTLPHEHLPQTVLVHREANVTRFVGTSTLIDNERLVGVITNGAPGPVFDGWDDTSIDVYESDNLFTGDNPYYSFPSVTEIMNLYTNPLNSEIPKIELHHTGYSPQSPLYWSTFVYRCWFQSFTPEIAQDADHFNNEVR